MTKKYLWHFCLFPPSPLGPPVSDKKGVWGFCSFPIPKLLQYPIWAERPRYKARRWENPKMYPPQLYPGPTIQSRSAGGIGPSIKYKSGALVPQWVIVQYLWKHNSSIASESPSCLFSASIMTKWFLRNCSASKITIQTAKPCSNTAPQGFVEPRWSLKTRPSVNSGKGFHLSYDQQGPRGSQQPFSCV